MTRPLPGLSSPKPVRANLPGAWGGYVLAVSPDGAYTCSIPTLTGTAMGMAGILSVPLSPPAVVGDRVWLISIEGNPDRLLIFARRA